MTNKRLLNILRWILLIICIYSAIVAYCTNNDLALSGYVVASLMTLTNFE
jgi:hypothetical protein